MSRQRTPQKFLDYAFAMASVLIALSLSVVLEPWFGRFAFFFFWPAVVLSALLGGLGPGLLATLLSVLVVNFFLLDPQGSFTFHGIDLIQLLTFGGITAFMSLVREQQRRSEREVAYQREAYRVTLASIGDGVIATDANGVVNFINEEAVRLTGWSVEAANGEKIETVFNIINETTHKPVEIPIIEALQKGRIVGLANHTILIARNDTHRYAISDSGAPILSADGRIVGAVLVFRDVSQQRQAEHRLELLQDLTAALAVAATVQEVANAIVEKGALVIGAHQGYIALLNRRVVEIINTAGIVPEAAERLNRVPLNKDYPFTDSIFSGKPVWLETFETYAFKYPKAADISRSITKTRAVVSIPFFSKGQAAGSISLTFREDHTFDEEERDFITSFVDVCAQSLERARLFEQASELATLQERQRLARELHDAVSQSLFAANMLAESLPRLWERRPERVADQLNQLHVLTRGAWSEMRTLLLELRPENIVNTPLPGLLTQLSQSIHGRKRIPVDLRLGDDKNEIRLPNDVHLALYRIAQESLNNIIKHANTKQIRVRLRLRQTPQGAVMTIVDNGVGFKMDDSAAGFGLGNMRERAEQIGATLSIRSKPGWGTRVSVIWQGETVSEPQPSEAAP